MKFDVNEVDSKYSFIITGASFIGEPRDNTMLFATKKVQHLLDNLKGHRDCLVYVEEGMEVPLDYSADNCIVACANPQKEYALLAVKIHEQEKKVNSTRKYTLTPGGYYIGENVTIGEGTFIEPSCMIDHDVIIGRNAFVGFGSVIKNCIIGNDFSCREHTVIGTDSFFFAEEEGDEAFRIPSFGKVIIEDHVDIGAQVVVERGFNSNTVFHNYVRIDAKAVIGHDTKIEDNSTVSSGATVAGLVTIGKDVYIAIDASIKQRLTIGDNAFVGMGAVVISDVKNGIKVFGNPARKAVM